MPPLPPLHVGIDIGEARLHVATSPLPTIPIQVIDLAAPDWHTQLIELIPPDSVVAYEPTGWHYSAPVVTVLNHIGCTVIQVEHRTTGYIRALRISGTKKDLTDAQALAYIAAQHCTAPLRGTHVQKPHIDQVVTGLRMLLWTYQRADKERTRATNRLKQLAHSIWPSLNDGLKIYRHAIDSGHVTPRELRLLAGMLQGQDFDLKDDPNLAMFATKRRRTTLINLVATLPPWLEAEHMADVIAQEAEALSDHERRREQVKELIASIVQRDPFKELTDLWMTVPGAGELSIAGLIVATHGKPAELTQNQFKATVGSHPHISQSGETTESVMARQGFKPAKRALYLWSLTLISMKNNPVAAVYRRRKARGQDFAIQAARAKLCAILWGIARTGTPYDPSLFAPESEDQP